jgi:hypothetical protein
VCVVYYSQRIFFSPLPGSKARSIHQAAHGWLRSNDATNASKLSLAACTLPDRVPLRRSLLRSPAKDRNFIASPLATVGIQRRKKAPLLANQPLLSRKAPVCVCVSRARAMVTGGTNKHHQSHKNTIRGLQKSSKLRPSPHKADTTQLHMLTASHAWHLPELPFSRTHTRTDLALSPGSLAQGDDVVHQPFRSSQEGAVRSVALVTVVTVTRGGTGGTGGGQRPQLGSRLGVPLVVAGAVPLALAVGSPLAPRAAAASACERVQERQRDRFRVGGRGEQQTQREPRTSEKDLDCTPSPWEPLTDSHLPGAGPR